MSFLTCFAGRLPAQQATTSTTQVPSKAARLISKVIYGDDDRLDVYQETDPVRVKLAYSVCGILEANDVINNNDGTYTVNTESYTMSDRYSYSLLACDGEPFGRQRTGPYCTGFLVGPDLIATAGHCTENETTGEQMWGSAKVIFGFRMESENQQAVHLDASQVYTPVAVVGHLRSSELPDYSIVRLDRPVTAFGAAPVNIRRAGSIAVNTQIGMIGYPYGLPEKIAFGSSTRVYDSSHANYFTANTDSYGGNSGSPIWNATESGLGVIEGILDRGADDYTIGATCFSSNKLSDSAADEDSSRATTFSSYVPELAAPWFNQLAYQDGQTLALLLTDTNAGTTISAQVSTTAGDSEAVTLSDPDGDRVYRGKLTINAAPAAVMPGNGLLEGSLRDVITATYHDAAISSGTGAADYTTTAPLDNAAPQFTSLSVTPGVNQVKIQFTTDEWSLGRVQYGTDEQALASEATTSNGPDGKTHTVTLSPLSACERVYFRLAATDAAGNSGLADNNGGNYSAEPKTAGGYYAPFDVGSDGWSHAAAIGTDNWATRVCYLAPSPSFAFTFEAYTNAVTDASLYSPALPAGQALEFDQFYNFETDYTHPYYYDGGVMEYSTDGGSSWSDMGARLTQGGYTATIYSGAQNPLAGRQGWGGNSGGKFIHCIANIAGLTNLRVRFRFGADNGTSSYGWMIDNVSIGGEADCVNSARQWQIYK